MTPQPSVQYPHVPVGRLGTPVILFSNADLDTIEIALGMHAHTLDASADYAGVLAKIRDARS